MILLNFKSNYSLLSSLCNIKTSVKKAKEYGYTSISLTDINNMYGAAEFYKECVSNEVKPIIGMELKYDDVNILLYVKNSDGYKNLIKLCTLVSTEKFVFEDLKKHKTGLICINLKEALNIFDLEYNLEDIHCDEVLYIKKGDQKYLDYAYAIRDGLKYDDDRVRAASNKYLKKPSELIISDKQKNNMLHIENVCNFELSYTPNLLPKLFEKDEYEYLVSLCKKGLEKRMNGEVSDEYISRLKHELNIINKLKFCGYFLVVWDFIRYSKQNGILVGPGRGSAAGSLVSYTLGITDIDPIKYNLLFERFLNPERITMPDIDMDFPSDKRDKVINYVTKKYGQKKVAQIITFGTMKSRAVIRDVGRVMDIPIKLVDRVCKLINHFDDLKTSYNKNNILRDLIDSSSDLKNMYDVCINLENMPRHTSVHAAGVVISNARLDNIIPLDKGIGNTLTTQYSMDYLEDLGLLKMDFLGLSNLTTIQNIIDDINKNEKEKIDYNNIALDDKKALDIFKNVNTVGIFQFESAGMKKFLEKLRADTFENIVAAIALFRPGPMENIDLFVRRKYGKEKIDYFHPDLKEILEDTYGVIVYQEQIMRIANVMADYSMGEADVLRRAMSKKKFNILKKEESKFVDRAVKKGYKEEKAEEVYKIILKFAGFGFNRAHSVAYSIIAYKMAYLKAHYPTYFMTNLLNSVIGNERKTKEYLYECKKNNINILKPDVNKSYYTSISTKDGIILGLGCIKSVGSAAANKIIEERRNKRFSSFYSFISRVYGKAVTRGVIENLIDASAFHNFGYKYATLHENLEKGINYAELTSGEEGLIKIDEPVMEDVSEYTKEELTDREYNVFGFYVSNHPVSKYKSMKGLTELSDVENNYDKEINIVCYVDYKKKVTTKKGDEMAFLNVSDELEKASVVLFPKIYDEYKMIKKGQILLVKGVVEKRLSNYQIVASKIKILA